MIRNTKKQLASFPYGGKKISHKTGEKWEIKTALRMQNTMQNIVKHHS
jgi:hypothetical protein